MEIDQNVGQYHLTGTSIVIKKAISYVSQMVQAVWGAKFHKL